MIGVSGSFCQERSICSSIEEYEMVMRPASGASRTVTTSASWLSIANIDLRSKKSESRINGVFF